MVLTMKIVSYRFKQFPLPHPHAIFVFLIVIVCNISIFGPDCDVVPGVVGNVMVYQSSFNQISVSSYLLNTRQNKM